MEDSTAATSDEMTIEEFHEWVLGLSQGDVFHIDGVPQLGYPLEFIHARSDGQGFHAVETESTEVPGHDTPFKHIWSFIIESSPDSPYPGKVLAHSTRDGVVPADATAATIDPTQYEYSFVSEFYPKAFRGL